MPPESQMPINPYAPMVGDSLNDPIHHAVDIRKKFLNHEASVKSIGLLYLLGAIFLVPIGFCTMGISAYALASNSNDIDSPWVVFIVGVFEFALGILQGITGLALKKLKKWARIVGIVFSSIGLIGFPLGTLISAYFLYLLASAKGNYVFSEEYQQVIASTPEIRYKTSMVVWILLGLLLGLIGLAVIAAIVGSIVN